MTTPYRPVQFSNEQPTRSRLQQLANNVQWIFENTPRMRYTVNSLVRDSGVKILAGRALFPSSTTSESRATIYFGNFFTAGCSPIVVATVQPRGGSKYVTVFNIAGGGSIDHTGFRAVVTAHEDASTTQRIAFPGWIHWHALGY